MCKFGDVFEAVGPLNLDSDDLSSGGRFVGSSDRDRFDGRGVEKSLELIAASGDDLLRGGEASDYLSGGYGDDDIYAYGGDDLIVLDEGSDFIDGGDGVDTVLYEGETGISIDLRRALQDNADLGRDRVRKIEDVTSGSGDDYLRGNNADNELRGGDGVDRLWGFKGDDVLVGGAGQDYLDGGIGNDTVLYEGETDVRIDLRRQWQDNDGHGRDRLNRIENVTTDSGDDFVRGNGGANILSGQDGSDRLFGHGGNDILIGGRGDDILSGGGGIDTYRFYLSEGVSDDLIRGFSDGEIIEIVNDTGDLSPTLSIDFKKNNTELTVNDELTVTLKDIQACGTTIST